jgi:hypothetical protein
VLSQANSGNQARLDMFKPEFHELQTIFPSSRGSSTGPWPIVGGKFSDENLEQQTNISYCVKVGRNACETLTILTLSCVQYVRQKLSIFDCCMQFKKGPVDMRSGQRSGQPTTQRTDTNVGRVRNLVSSVRLIIEECYRTLFGE